MKIQFLGWISTVIILFVLGSTVGEGHGTMDSVFYYPIVADIFLGLIYFFIRGLKDLF